MIKSKKLIDRATYRDEAGQRYEVLTYQEMIDASSKDDPHAVIPGLKSLRLANGEQLNYVDESTVYLVLRDKTLTRT